MQRDLKIQTHKSRGKEARLVAKRALLQVLEPIAGFVLDSGLSAAEMRTILLQAIVKSAVSKQLEVSDRVNLSGIAAITGISRSEVSRIVKSSHHSNSEREEGQFQSTNRILAAWHDDPKFIAPDGQPADLPLYGRGASFESLARKYGLGLPTRAVLDELVRFGAVELLSDQRIRTKTSMAIERGMSARVVKGFGDRASELLCTMLHNMREPDDPKFIASVTESAVPISTLPLFRKELGIKGADFLSEVQERLSQSIGSRSARSSERATATVSVTIFYHETDPSMKEARLATMGRRNFRRESKP